MARDVAFFSLLIGIVVIPGLALAWFRGGAINRTYQTICQDLKRAGIEPSGGDLQLLIYQLHRKPRAALETDGNAEARAIKEKPIESLIAYLRSIRQWFYVVGVFGSLALISFQHFWPKR